ncbi:MAG: DNA mismatch repair endonuclease MutL [Proteobacteria bacterium]|nr:DNA mismatch repair endonuclease MutL [Desulfobulbaceae bacterium]MBU4152061.1 DNA mismatch repair endonuclease MutL [Pseudomonadota bacterium]
MSRIRILTENLANQIAAGEVVERPASVVKELVENAIDAGATQISIQVEGAGTRMVRIIDNGSGMDSDDALLCLERHATSKLRSSDDLVRLQTLGFRGEAIPSIASVARVSITTRTADAVLGCRVDVRFGSVYAVHEMGCAQGTVIEVADLFANVPARRKFLKSANTELAHIDEVIRSYALVRYQTGFKYQVNGRDVIDLPAGDELPERRVRQVLGECPGLIALVGSEVNARTDIQVAGHLVPPGLAGGRAGRLWTFVNGRYIKDRMITHAVAEGMQGFLMKGGRPAGVIHVTLPPEAVDVNVHPTKQEVRFSEGNLVHNKIVAAVWQSMEAYQERLKGEIFGQPRKDVQAGLLFQAPKTLGADRGGVPPDGDFRREELPLTRSDQLQAPVAMGVVESAWVPEEGGALFEACEPQPLPFGVSSSVKFETELQGEQPSAPLCEPPMPGQDEERGVLGHTVDADEVRPPVRYLGQLLGTYLLCEVEDGLIAIDQHAVQERLIFEEMKRHYAASTMPSQILMFPAMIELVPAEIQALDEYGAEFLRLGLDVQSFGGDTVVVKAVPAALGHLSPVEIFRGILGRYVEVSVSGHGSGRLEEILAGMACKAAIKAGHRLVDREVQHLLDQMHLAGIFSHCPHGRPVVKRFSKYDIEKWFQRS